MTQRALIARLTAGMHAYRQLGPARGTATAARRVAATGRGRIRAYKLERNPIRISTADVRAALGGRSVTEALHAAREALPTVRRWVEALPALDPPARSDLLRRANDVAAHRLDLLGSGLTELGPDIDWHVDFKSGRRWPLVHISRVPVSYPDNSDIKVPWELSRFQHLPLLAAAHLLTEEVGYLDEIDAQLDSWIAANPVEFGVNWACTMDVAIRGVNWVAALALCADRIENLPHAESVVASLLLHARFIRSHLEYESARGNHYLSDVVGLLVIASLFEGSPEGRDWAHWATRQLGSELAHQVRADGCVHEASTSYHRLVTELFIVGRDAAQSLAPDVLDPAVPAGIDRMLAFATDYTRPDGLAPQIGDADNGRLLPLGDYASGDQRSHVHLFAQAGVSFRPATRSAAYRDGGFYILRAGDLYVAVRCGDVGIHGRGCHAHNDLTGFELSWGDRPLVVDPGSYLYTADPVERNRFRSTAVHSVLQVDEAEQNEIRADRLFAMVDRARGSVLDWEVGETATALRCRHHGYEALSPPVAHVRTLRLDGARDTLEITDEVDSKSAHDLSWSLPLTECEVEVTEGGAVARWSDVTLYVDCGSLDATVESGWLSPGYGERVPTPVIRLRGRSQPGRHSVMIVLRVEPSR